MKINSHGKPNIIGQDDSYFLTHFHIPSAECMARIKKNQGGSRGEKQEMRQICNKLFRTTKTQSGFQMTIFFESNKKNENGTNFFFRIFLCNLKGIKWLNKR